ncbi:CPBP family intramembrane glutamic endopeptidase [Aquitalea sp.]|uniref:CPBP family intramembrane glutamic endopeptidase n=1 Tax=Aquitalea sp. TaxID=1872623 RepID=UPI002585E63C|nr:CPBP family intramembrane glutamic endopeptidase [Aquitalea sp.]
MPMMLPATVELASFGWLAIALLLQCLGLPRSSMLAGLGAIGLALLCGLLQPLGLLALAVAGSLSYVVYRFPRPEWRVLWLALLLALALHALPGFDNPLLWQGRATPDSQVYRLFWSFDKGVAGWLLLLGLHDAPHRGRAWGGTVAAVGLLLLMLVLALAQESGLIAYAPKLPAWILPWLFANFFLTALPEEALFRHGLQRWLENRIEPLPALIGASLLFGAAHVAGGWGWVGLATLAGLGYGLVYAATRQVALAALAHLAFNTVHLLLFTYPRPG